MCPDPPKKTLEQVKAELFLKLYKNARKLLQGSSPPDTNKPDFQDLVLVLDTVAKQNFVKQYGYDYKGNQSVPKEKNIKNLSSSDGLLSISSSNDPQIVNYVQFLLNNTNVKSQFVLNTARAGLVNQGRLLFNSPMTDNWNALPDTKIYNDPDADKNPWYADVQMVEVNAGLTIDGQGAKYTFIYYVGVYYEKISETALKNRLLRVLLDNAKKLPSAAAVASADPATVQQIQAALLNAAKAKFLADYKVPYKVNDTAPKDLAVGKAKDVRGTDNIYYLQDTKAGGIPTFVETSLLSAIDFQRNDVKFAKKEAIATLTKELTDILKNTTDNSWLHANFNYTYNSTNLTEMSVKVISVIFYTKGELKDGQSDVKATFISFLGVYYHIVSPEDQAVQSLLEILYASAGQLYNPPIHFAPPYTTQGLQGVLNGYSDTRFLQIYGVPYKGDDTAPKDEIKPGGIKRLTSNQNTLVIKDNDWKILDIIIEVQITNGLIIPDWLIEKTAAELKKAFLAAQSLAVDDSIQSAKFNKVYQDSIDQSGYQWKSSIILLFTNGVLQEGGVKVTRTFVSFTGVFYPIQPLKTPALLASSAVESLASQEEEGFALL